jgi:hypothetical protein
MTDFADVRIEFRHWRRNIFLGAAFGNGPNQHSAVLTAGRNNVYASVRHPHSNFTVVEGIKVGVEDGGSVAQKSGIVVGQFAESVERDDGELAAARCLQVDAEELWIDFDQVCVPCY